MARFKPIRLNDLTLKELREEVEHVQRLYNRRLKRLEKSGLAEVSPSYYDNDNKVRKPTSVDPQVLDRSQAEKFYLNYANWLTNKTSTPAGVRAYRTKMRKKLGLSSKDKLFTTNLDTKRKRLNAREREKQFWTMYNNSEEALRSNLPSDRLIKMLRKIRRKRSLTEQQKMDMFNNYMQELQNSYKNKRFTLNDDTFLVTQMKVFKK